MWWFQVFSLPSSFPFCEPKVRAIGNYFKSGGYSINNTKCSKRFYTPLFSEAASVSGSAKAVTPFRMFFQQTKNIQITL